ncbi:MAG: hypothetical protein JW768_15795 [Chitinispirillaceae bacterium]|nr:hypothetical protein [Chitinispirillaceae bacterium]
MPRSSAMGGSDMSLVRGAQPLSNPANLSSDSIHLVELAYAGFYNNTFSASALSYLFPVDKKSSLGVSMSYLFVPGITINNDTIAPGIEDQAHQLYFRAGYGRTILDRGGLFNLSAGGALNGERMDLTGGEIGYCIALDIGATLVFPQYGLAVSALLENATASYVHWGSQSKYFAYPHGRVGIGWEREFPYIYGRLKATYLSPDLLSNEGINSYVEDSINIGDDYDPDYTFFDRPEKTRLLKNPMLPLWGRYGAEYAIMNRIAFRMGYSPLTKNFTFGAGLGFLENRAGIDFAYLTHELAPTYKLSVNFKWL